MQVESIMKQEIVKDRSNYGNYGNADTIPTPLESQGFFPAGLQALAIFLRSDSESRVAIETEGRWR